MYEERNIVKRLRNVYSLGFPNTLIPFHSLKAILWQFDVAGNNKTSLGLHVKCPIFLHNFNQI